MKLKTCIPIIILLTFFTGCSSPTAPKEPKQINKGDYAYFKEYMNWFIKEQMKEQNIVGLSVALVDNQTIVWQKGFGYEDQEKGIKATKDTIYRAGSITKTINAMAVMKLVEEKKMDIDKPLKTYLPGFSMKSRFGSTDLITPRNIMTHHSGIPSDWLDKMFSTKPIPYNTYVKLIKDEYVAYPPNTILSYSNLAITLLGNAVEKTADTPYPEFIKTSFLQPMNMNNSNIKAALDGEGTSKSYDNGKEIKDEYPISTLPAGALNTTVSDLANLAIMIHNDGKFNNKTILQKDSLNEMLTVQNENTALDLDTKVGLGFFMYDRTFNDVDRIYYHGGDTVNHHAYFTTTEKSKLSVIVMTNTKNANIWVITNEMLKQAREAQTGQKIPSKKIVTTKLSKASDIEGTYATKLGKVDITKEDNGVYQTNIMGKSIQLKMKPDNKYYLKYMLFGVIPISNEMIDNITVYTKNINGKTILIYDNYGQKNLFGIKVKPQTISQVWINRAGTYYIVNPQELKSMQIEKVVAKIENNFPILEVTMKTGETLNYILKIISDNEAIIEGIGRRMRETIRVKNGIFYYMGLQFKLEK